jgi:N-acetylmuramoyl-L-alanine amidase
LVGDVVKIGKSIITRIIEIFIIIILIIILMTVYNKILEIKEINSEEKIIIEKTNTLFSDIENDYYAHMNKYTIYGNHLNIGGYIDANHIENIDITDLKLVLTDLDRNEIEYDLNINKTSDSIEFTLSDNINEGIDLEKIYSGEYYLFIKLNEKYKNKDVEKYITLENETEYSSNEYYTLTNNGKNRKIEITFSSYLLKNKYNIDYMKITSADTSLPDDVYDIVIDPGHGGKDKGAIYEDNYESDYTLMYSLQLKEKLEKIGYKVKLTRQSDEYVAPYGENGRAIVPYDTKAKLFISIHFNSTSSELEVGGVEIYAANNENLDFAKNFADNIVKMAQTNYSQNNQWKAYDGVYVKTYSEDDIKEAIEYAKDLGYEPYENITTSTPYYFMIRETGGIMTHAYIDGRNKTIGDNPYYNSNISAESYLLELGFINEENNLKNLQENKDAYIDAIVKTIVDNYNL